MTDSKVQLGEVVRLKSGGPWMTADMHVGGNSSRVQCRWFDGTELREGNFSDVTLERRQAGDR